jgi:P27 family predicted phage terminase small subunit
MSNPRKPVNAHLLQGTFREDRQPKAKGEFILEIPPAPESLSAYAREEWVQLAPRAVELGTLTEADLRAFALLCETLATEREAREIISKDGITLPTGGDGKKGHPAIRILETARTQAMRLFDAFGLTPKGRQHVPINPPREPNPFDDF